MFQDRIDHRFIHVLIGTAKDNDGILTMRYLYDRMPAGTSRHLHKRSIDTMRIQEISQHRPICTDLPGMIDLLTSSSQRDRLI